MSHFRIRSHLANNGHGLARELLLELLNQATIADELVELRELRHGDEDNNGLLVLANLNLLTGSGIQSHMSTFAAVMYTSFRPPFSLSW